MTPIVQSEWVKICLTLFFIQNGLKGDALPSSLLNSAFKIFHQEDPRKPGGTEIEWDKFASGLC
jgi:hypothetical protein